MIPCLKRGFRFKLGGGNTLTTHTSFRAGCAFLIGLSFAVGVIGPPFRAAAMDSRLAAWYPLDADAADHSGNGHHGAVVDTVVFSQLGAIPATGWVHD